ncbi:MAG: N-acetylmuramoyl-L-alanine amidase [Elusimicrobiota bacterium]|nr:N-acetylmuramoyl-L-alanine amidase [Elusimicrobiota bacterium]
MRERGLNVFAASALFFGFCALAHAGVKIVRVHLLKNSSPAGSFNIMLKSGMGYIGTKDIANIFSLRAEWLKKDKCINLVNSKERHLKLFMHSKKVYIDGRLCSLNKEPFLVDGQSWLPLELVLTKSFQHFAAVRVGWDYSAKVLDVTKEGFARKRPAGRRKTAVSSARRAGQRVSNGKQDSRRGGLSAAKQTFRKTKRAIKTVVIDPGHGGKDPGAVASDGTREKDIVLDIALRLYKLLKKDRNFNAILTRKSDNFLPLSSRAMIANKAHADLFLSIHTNASYKKKTRGFEVYFMSNRASDDEAQNVANTENAVVELEENVSKTPVNTILWSMAMNEFMNESSECCSFLKNRFGKMFAYNRGVKQAGFYVLKGAHMPAALVEIGFLTNKKDRKILKRSSNRQLIAEKLYASVKEYREYRKGSDK